MRRTGPMTALTSGAGSAMHQRQLRVRTIAKLLRDIRVAERACIGAGKVSCDRRSCFVGRCYLRLGRKRHCHQPKTAGYNQHEL
jgi:hypothetical protein